MTQQPDRPPYHHGDLRAALLSAGETVLEDTGVEGFSLRKVARLVGVSHSAPAHHFGDSGGLLMAIAADGFRRLLISMQDHHQAQGPEPRSALNGSGIGYLTFAQASPATFRLMFGYKSPEPVTAELEAAGKAAFEHLAQHVEAITQRNRTTDPDVMQDIIACWSMVHGFATLLISGGLAEFRQKSPEEQLSFFQAVFSRSLPA